MPTNLRSAYSAHEYTSLYSNIQRSSGSGSTIWESPLPADIVIEALVSVLIVSTGLVLGADKLKPVSWSVWAGEIERQGGAKNPFLFLEERYGFWDIRVSFLDSFLQVAFLILRVQAKRKVFANWIRGDAEEGK